MDLSLKEKAYTVIRQRIVDGTYAPGSMLNEKEIIAEIGVSRTPFREATAALAKENLIAIIPRRGMYVAEVTVKDIVDMYGMRDVLEPFTVRLAMENRLPREKLAVLQRRVEMAGKTYAQVLRDDEDIHGLLLGYADNAHLTRTLQGLRSHGKRIRAFAGKNDADVTDINLEHITLLEAMLEGGTGQAENQMKQHIAASKRRVFERIFKTGAAPVR